MTDDFAEVVAELTPPIRRYFGRRGYSRADIDDLTQNTLLKLWRYRDRYSMTIGCALTFAKQQAADFYRRTPPVEGIGILPESTMTQPEQHAVVEDFLYRMTTRDSVIVRMRADGKTLKEIGAELGLNKATVMVRLRVVRWRARREFEFEG